jgi:hypothetical protein
MSVLESLSSALADVPEDPFFDESEVAAAAFLARYSGRTLDACRYDRGPSSSGLPMLRLPF